MDLDNSNANYQHLIYLVAQYIKPNQANKFKKDYGIKQLSNQVIELNKVVWESELKPNIQNYYQTDKIDGKRTILYIETNNKCWALSDIAIKLNVDLDFIKGPTILDTEYYKEKYYVFDVMVFNGINLTSEPFEQRMTYFDKFKHNEIIKTKLFERIGSNYSHQIGQFKKKSKPYEIDGIILTPSNGQYNTMKVFKYKSVEFLTIDFLIKKCPESKKNNYILFCGISKKVFFKLRMRLINGYDRMFPHISVKNLPHYFPIQFEPSNKTIGYIYNDPDSNENLDNKVGEFLYDTNLKIWKLVRIRTDRDVEVSRGNYFGNNYKIAELNWMSLFDPLVIENEQSDANTQSNGQNYFQEHNNSLQKSSRNFNSFVKSKIFEKFNGTNKVMDLASGKGQDLFRYSTHNMKNIIFLEIDRMALTELITRKHNFSSDSKYSNSMNVKIQNVNLLDNYKSNIKLIENVYNRQDIDLIICNFALHYFTGSIDSIKNIVKLINYYLNSNPNSNAHVVFTAFDSNKINQLFKTFGNEWIIKTNNEIKYGIVKKYSGDIVKPFGQKINVLLPFSKNTYYEEYLVNIDTIAKEFEKYNIYLKSNESFGKYLNLYDGWMDLNDKIYVSLYHCYIFSRK